MSILLAIYTFRNLYCILWDTLMMGWMFWRSAIYLNSSSKLNTYQGDDQPQPAGAAICGLIYWWYVRGRYADIAAWPSHHQLASISGSQYLLYLLSDDLLSPISTLPSLAPAPAILTRISRASLVPGIDLADMLVQCCNHNVGGKYKAQGKWQMATFTTAWTFAIKYDYLMNT